MKLKKYKELYNHAPFSKEEFIDNALEIEDDNELVKKAERLQKAKKEFDKALRDREIFYG